MGLWPTSHSLSWTLICSYYLSLLDTLDFPCLPFNLWPLALPLASCSWLLDSIPDSYIVADTVGTLLLDLWGLPLCQVCSLFSVFHVYVIELRITTVSVCHICSACPCLRESLYMSGLISVSPSQKIKLYIDDPTHIATWKSCLTNSWTNIESPLVRMVCSFHHPSRANTNSCNNLSTKELNAFLQSQVVKLQTQGMTLPM